MHVLILDSAQFQGGETGAVDDNVGFLAGMMRAGCVGDVLEDCTLEHDAILAALGDQPGEVDGCVDADGGPVGSVVDSIA